MESLIGHSLKWYLLLIGLTHTKTSFDPLRRDQSSVRLPAQCAHQQNSVCCKNEFAVWHPYTVHEQFCTSTCLHKKLNADRYYGFYHK